MRTQSHRILRQTLRRGQIHATRNTNSSHRRDAKVAERHIFFFAVEKDGKKKTSSRWAAGVIVRIRYLCALCGLSEAGGDLAQTQSVMTANPRKSGNRPGARMQRSTGKGRIIYGSSGKRMTGKDEGKGTPPIPLFLKEGVKREYPLLVPRKT